MQSALDKPAYTSERSLACSTIVKPVKTGDATTDSTAVHVTTVNGTQRGGQDVTIPVYIGVHTRYKGSSHDPTVQLLYYYRKFLEAVLLSDTCMYPCVGLTVVDNVIIAGILYLLPQDATGVRYIAYSHVASYVLHYYEASSEEFQKVVAFFTAMRELMTQLRAYYAAMKPSAEGVLHSTERHSLTVGDRLSGKLHVEPRPKYHTKLLFTGRVLEAFDGVPKDLKHVMVKYVQFYGKAAHEAAVDLRIAPALYAVENIASGMKVVVMELLEGFTPLCKLTDKHVRRTAVQAVANALKALHGKGFVHGDVHEANVLVHDKSGGAEVRLVDFDWSGRHGEATYPVIPNPVLEWHPDVARGKVMLAGHDIHACTALAAYVENPEAATKRQTVTPPELLAGAATLVEHDAKGDTAAKAVSALMATTVAITADTMSGAGAVPSS
jgi:serine/threonine protein kinase